VRIKWVWQRRYLRPTWAQQRKYQGKMDGGSNMTVEGSRRGNIKVKWV
jgi:hypothetical protein